MANLRRTADARNDLLAIWLYIAQDSVGAADRLMEEVDRTLRLVTQFPLMGESVDHIRQGTRRVMVGNYQLFYEPNPDEICLLRVFHAARRIEDLFE